MNNLLVQDWQNTITLVIVAAAAIYGIYILANFLSDNLKDNE